ncbi:M50 family metallopeptidase [Nakamurella aerolata]|uniref:CBS domain-containing protein n=1 Tax=Nakamurella aerolata TaxID=1656892 RepID=A0A849A349_9ACTN|nr:M50 family metallopeptidase [Nakamurella aerolata]NNG34497.1 CBS domain-containing protein [Nakamurella aerolata]
MTSARRGTRLGRIAGVPVLLNASWPASLAIVLAVVVLLARRLLPDDSTLGAVVAGVVLTVLLLVSVLLHECGHLFAAKAVGQRPVRISFDVLGGQTDILDERDSMPGSGADSGAGTRPDRSRASADAIVAVAGPLVSGVVGGAGLLAAHLVRPDTGPWLLFMTVGVVNLLLAVFNLLPAVPMDGGELMRSIVWRITGKQSAGTIAGYLGTTLVCGGLLLLAVLGWLRMTAGPGRWLVTVVLVAMAVHLAVIAVLEARRELAYARLAAVVAARRGAASAPGSGDADPAGAVVLTGDGAEELAELLRRNGSSSFVVVDDEGRAVGRVSRRELELRSARP